MTSAIALTLTTANAIAFPIKFPEQGAKPQAIQDEFKIADISIDPKTVEVGDLVEYDYTLPVRHTANVDFRSKDRGLPDFLQSTADGVTPFPIQNYRTDHRVVYTVISKPKATNIVKWSLWGLETNADFSLGTGLSRVRVVKCGDEA